MFNVVLVPRQYLCEIRHNELVFAKVYSLSRNMEATLSLANTVASVFNQAPILTPSEFLEIYGRVFVFGHIIDVRKHEGKRFKINLVVTNNPIWNTYPELLRQYLEQ